ncbi:MAG: M15 family metallopeptidase [Ilumatobacteraceae bacterium]
MSRTRVLAVSSVVVSLVVVALAGTAPASGAPRSSGTGLPPVIVISRDGPLTTAEVSRISSAARTAGATAHPARYATLPMTAYRRGDVMLMRQPKGWRVPMGTRVLPVDYVRLLAGDEAAGIVSTGGVLMGASSARIRDARVGDEVTLRDSRNRIRRFTVGMIVPNDVAGGEDLIMSSSTGASLGVTGVPRVEIVGFAKPSEVYTALRTRGLALGTRYRVRTSWDPPNPDATLGFATMKLELGEFAFRPTSSAAIIIEDPWRTSNIDWLHRYAALPLRNNCHRKVVDAIEGAFRDIVKAGLRDRIDLRNSQRYGGCYVARYNRLAGLFGSPSRHAFGAAIDLNTTTNAQGARPRMDCRIVRIFRRWGFAWGGNFWPADGMHFEWVGERRDTLGFPSRYCPNNVPVPTTSVPEVSTSTSTTTSTTSTSTTVPDTSTTTVPESTTTSTMTSTTTSP